METSLEEIQDVFSLRAEVRVSCPFAEELRLFHFLFSDYPSNIKPWVGKLTENAEKR